MRKTIIYGGIALISGIFFSACSNVDDADFAMTVKDSTNVIFSETFESSIGQFTAKSVIGDQIWAENTSGYVLMTGYVNSVNVANEDWLISPEIDLTNVSSSHLSFDHAARYFGNLADEATVWVCENYKADSVPGGANWVKLQTSAFADPGSWVFVSSGEISLTAFAGKKIRVALKYLSTNTKAGTWEMKNFLIEKGEASVDPNLLCSERFASSLGQFTTQSVTGDQVWTVDPSRGYILMSGYVGGNNYANEDWLISPEIDLTSVQTAHFSFDHAARYFGTLAAEATVWVSDNYSSGLPSTATWTQVVTSPFVDSGSWTFSNSQQLSLTKFAGKKIHVAFKYLSSSKAGSWEIKNFLVEKGEANGIESNPYKISEAISAQTGGTSWVEGYIVGYARPFLSQNAYFFTADTCTQQLNVILSDTTANLYSYKCLCVQLPRGGIRNALNLSTNKSVLGKKVRIYGTLSPNMGMAGLLSPTKFVLSDTITGTSSITKIFSETFATNLGAFTQNNVVGPSQAWKWQSGFGATMSGYSGGNVQNEDWFISPSIDLTKVSAAALSFDHTINKGVLANLKTDHTLWISTDDGANWSQLTITTYPAGNNWTYVNSGEIDLDKYAGKTIKIAFKYTSSTTSSATWEIKNFTIYN